MPKVWLLDYGAGNVRSLRNALAKIGFEIEDVTSAEQIATAQVLIFPGVGSFGRCMEVLREKKWEDALRAYVQANRPFFGICLGMQSLFEASEESPGVRGLGVIPSTVLRFRTKELSVPQIGWNGVVPRKPSAMFQSLSVGADSVYFVHSFRVSDAPEVAEWALCHTDYGSERYISGVQRGRVAAVQFHPEKSGEVGLSLLRNFLSDALKPTSVARSLPPPPGAAGRSLATTRLCKRVIACLDVRSNDAGDLIVTKGDQYDVRGGGDVRNLGKPVALAQRYYDEGADEVTFLNITGFRGCPLDDLPMLQVLMEASKNCFVPLTVGGGIRSFTDDKGNTSSALDVASAYFRAGADKVSIGSDAVDAAKELLARGGKADGSTAIEQISHVYGRQAVVISVDPRRVWVQCEADANGHALVDHGAADVDKGVRGPNGERLCWYECTVQGGRKGSDLDVVQLAKATEALGAGELLLNCIDCDGQNAGYDVPLVRLVKATASIPVIASSGAGTPAHFSEVFERTGVEAALAASIFHRHVVAIEAVKDHLTQRGIAARRTGVGGGGAVDHAGFEAGKLSTAAFGALAASSARRLAGSCVAVAGLVVLVAAAVFIRQRR